MDCHGGSGGIVGAGAITAIPDPKAQHAEASLSDVDSVAICTAASEAETGSEIVFIDFSELVSNVGSVSGCLAEIMMDLQQLEPILRSKGGQLICGTW